MDTFALAEKAGMAYQYLSILLADVKPKRCQTKTGFRLAEALDVDISLLLSSGEGEEEDRTGGNISKERRAKGEPKHD